MKISKMTMAGAAAGLLLTSCASTFHPEKVAAEWDAVTIGSQQVTPGPKAPYIGFDAGNIYGFTGCNRINGGISLDGKKFSANNVSTTMMFCQDAVYEQDFLQALQHAKALQRSEEGFELLDEEGNAVAAFVPRSIDLKAIEGKWMLASLNGKKMELKEEETPFLQFDLKENHLGGFTGCNRINATLDQHLLKNGHADFSQMGMTRMMGKNHELEADFVETLQHARNLRISKGLLYVYAENDGCLIFEKQ